MIAADVGLIKLGMYGAFLVIAIIVLLVKKAKAAVMQVDPATYVPELSTIRRDFSPPMSDPMRLLQQAVASMPSVESTRVADALYVTLRAASGMFVRIAPTQLNGVTRLEVTGRRKVSLAKLADAEDALMAFEASLRRVLAGLGHSVATAGAAPAGSGVQTAPAPQVAPPPPTSAAPVSAPGWSMATAPPVAPPASTGLSGSVGEWVGARSSSAIGPNDVSWFIVGAIALVLWGLVPKVGLHLYSDPKYAVGLAVCAALMVVGVVRSSKDSRFAGLATGAAGIAAASALSLVFYAQNLGNGAGTTFGKIGGLVVGGLCTVVFIKGLRGGSDGSEELPSTMTPWCYGAAGLLAVALIQQRMSGAKVTGDSAPGWLLELAALLVPLVFLASKRSTRWRMVALGALAPLAASLFLLRLTTHSQYEEFFGPPLMIASRGAVFAMIIVLAMLPLLWFAPRLSTSHNPSAAKVGPAVFGSGASHAAPPPPGASFAPAPPPPPPPAPVGPPAPPAPLAPPTPAPRTLSALPAAEFAVLFDNGATVGVRNCAVIGRAPIARPDDIDAQLLPVEDHTMSVSKSHLAVGRDAQGFWVQDRSSTNGASVQEPDGTNMKLLVERKVRVQGGSRVAFGDRWLELR